MSFTSEQTKAINASGNILVSAGAGAGKTRTLVERCIRLILDEGDPIHIREVLIVTFTEAAAAEVRKRVREHLEKHLESAPNERIESQLAALDSAFISTLHSFCFSLVREHFYELDIDPGVSVLDQTEANVLASETLDEVLKEHYEGKHSFSSDVLDFLRVHLNGWETPLRELIQKLHHYTQTRANPDEWFTSQETSLDAGANPAWEDWYQEGIQSWCQSWIPLLQTLPECNSNAHVCRSILERASADPQFDIAKAILERIESWPKGKKTEHKKAFENLFKEAQFLASISSRAALVEDWQWARKPLGTLLKLARQFNERFAQVKRERSVVDFHDLEQFTLKLLWNGGPTQLASEWQKRFRAIFVDEYQDINRAQDCIIRALSSPDLPGNLFLVGDIKQSIYRFRQADPSIFRSYFEKNAGWTTAYLRENFRSHEGVLNFVNPFFTWLMKRELGGVDYDDRATLLFGEAPGRESMTSRPETREVELHVLSKEKNYVPEEGADEAEDVEQAELEARLVAWRLRKMKDEGTQIYDQREESFRPVRWKDMVVLLRSAAKKVETYAKAFEAMGVPLQTKRDAFYSTQEVCDLCNLLHILDNPLQDLPLVGVLRSPLVGLSAADLTSIRLSAKTAYFWQALERSIEGRTQFPGRSRVEHFLNRYRTWRESRKSASLSQRLERILIDTGYADWLRGQPQGRQRYANVQQFLQIARRFDEVRGESLYLFLRHIEELQKIAGDLKPPSASAEDAVALMTVHQSKGLEFPVVALAGLGSGFNKMDEQNNLLFSDRFGLCSMIKAPDRRHRYPSLPLWLARQQEKMDRTGEEIRILYVALTRAQNFLFLFGSATPKQINERWPANAVGVLHPRQIVSASGALDWIGTFMAREPNLASFVLHEGVPGDAKPSWPDEVKVLPPGDVTAVQKRLQFSYPHLFATEQAAKTSVSALRRSMSPDEESLVFLRRGERNPSAEKRGTAYHTLMQHLDLSIEINASSVRNAVETLVKKGVLPLEDSLLIDVMAVANFWGTEFAREVLSQRDCIRRELPFTFKLTREVLLRTGMGQGSETEISIPNEEFVIVQGVADLVVLRPDDIWLLDFKSDGISRLELAAATEKYRVQIQLYASALSATYQRPVTQKGLYFLSTGQFAWIE